MQKRTWVLNLLILTTLFGLVITGWVLGHIYRHSIPEFQQPRDSVPGEKIGSFSDLPSEIYLGLPIKNWEVPAWMECKNDLVYTSLPAKCQTTDGRMMEVGNDQPPTQLIPQLTPP